MLIWPQNVQQKYPPHHKTSSSSRLNCWYKAGWIHVFHVLFTPNYDPTIWMLQQTPRLIKPPFPPQYSVVQFWWVVASISYLWLTGVAPLFILCTPYRWMCGKTPVDQPVWCQQQCHIQCLKSNVHVQNCFCTGLHQGTTFAGINRVCVYWHYPQIWW